MSMKKYLAMITGSLLVSSSAMAVSDNTITFQGEVSDETCSVVINGNQAKPVVLLPTVSTKELSEQGKTAGPITFDIGLSGCTGSQTKQQKFPLSLSVIRSPVTVTWVILAARKMLKSNYSTLQGSQSIWPAALLATATYSWNQMLLKRARLIPRGITLPGKQRLGQSLPHFNTPFRINNCRYGLALKRQTIFNRQGVVEMKVDTRHSALYYLIVFLLLALPATASWASVTILGSRIIYPSTASSVDVQ